VPEMATRVTVPGMATTVNAASAPAAHAAITCNADAPWVTTYLRSSHHSMPDCTTLLLMHTHARFMSSAEGVQCMQRRNFPQRRNQPLAALGRYLGVVQSPCLDDPPFPIYAPQTSRPELWPQWPARLAGRCSITALLACRLSRAALHSYLPLLISSRCPRGCWSRGLHLLPIAAKTQQSHVPGSARATRASSPALPCPATRTQTLPTHRLHPALCIACTSVARMHEASLR
jgi:hypothetical protein